MLPACDDCYERGVSALVLYVRPDQTVDGRDAIAEARRRTSLCADGLEQGGCFLGHYLRAVGKNKKASAISVGRQRIHAISSIQAVVVISSGAGSGEISGSGAICQ